MIIDVRPQMSNRNYSLSHQPRLTEKLPALLALLTRRGSTSAPLSMAGSAMDALAAAA
jgi:hypothetical protein